MTGHVGPSFPMETSIDGGTITSPSNASVASPDLVVAYSRSRRLWYLTAAVAAGVCVAGFWNFRVVDGFGSDVVAANTIGGYEGRASEFATLGAGFGFLFALVAGLAATFTACNCAAFAMIPGLVCAPGAKGPRSSARASVGAMLF